MPKCPATDDEMVDFLDLALFGVPGVTMTKIDRTTGAVCVLSANGKCFRLRLSSDPDDVG